ncbi:hypothetical protein BKA64DRAFT_263796 [Cadophora sp. MPI-SDFR-AT-0126]|nr:hypothetical protein BKA64DRAFT_263796 [Leotiomycetes sp. MPI-SDFR-AT-0126]
MDDHFLLLEFLCMSLHAPLESLATFAGKQGAEEAQRISPAIEDWALSPGGRKSLWYAAQVYRLARKLPPVLIRDFRAIVVYSASLVFWIYGVIHGARAAKGLALSSQSRERDARSVNEAVLLDGDLSSRVHKFISIAHGLPGLSVPSSIGGQLDYSNTTGSIFVHDISSMMGVALEILEEHGQGCESIPSDFVENITSLMRGLAQAAQAIGLG